MPKTEYDFLYSGQTTKIPNIFRQIRVDDRRFDNITAYETFQVQNMRPDQVSYELYGNVEHYWTFFLINKHLNGGMKDWPMTHQTMENHLNRKYSGFTIRPFRDPGPEALTNPNEWNPEIHEGDNYDFNMVASRFNVGDLVYIAGDNANSPEGPYGYLTERDIVTNQLHFRYADDTPGTFSFGDDIRVGSYYVDQSQKENPDDPKLKYTLTPRRESVHHFTRGREGSIYTNYYNYEAADDIITNTQFEKLANDERGKIRVIRKQYINDFAIKYRQLVNG